MTDIELAEEIEKRRGGSIEYLGKLLWSNSTRIIAALRRGPEPVLGLARTIPDPLGRTMCTAEATGQLAERQPSVMVPREPTAAMLGEAWALFGLTPVRASEIYKAMLSAAEASKEAK